MDPEPDKARRARLQDHIAGLESAVSSVRRACEARPTGAERDQMSALAGRLQHSADQLRGELDDLARRVAGLPAVPGATDLD